ncbi:tetratricopeptide repeat protein [Egbenema bharatensis]|uniref:tetratricopeptide repeat protein n=1 Tax=Egbenema bharatensis TaxID=3463334 RepID=UPI003A8B1815
MGVSVDVDQTNFMPEVVEASYQKPVLIDFFAQWCGPCQMLKPVLEKLVQEYDFILAKIDIDQNPELANSYRVEGVPDVRIVSQGQMYQGFVGVLPEPKIRDLLSQLNLKSDLEGQLAAAQSAAATGEPEKAKAIFAQLIEQYPQSRLLLIEAAKFLVSQDRMESAEKLLSSIGEQERTHYAQANALRELIQLKQTSQSSVDQELDPAFSTAIQQAIGSNYEAALQNLVAIVGENRKYRDDGARKAMLIIFNLLGDTHPLTMQYRMQLAQALY